MIQTTPAILGGKPALEQPQHQHKRWPNLTEDDKRAVQAVLDRGVLSGPFAPEATALQREFAAFVGVKHCLTTHSGTSALHLGVAAAGIGAGDEVITTAFSFIATALSCLQHQAIPVFVDIDPATFNLDPNLVEKAITPRTKAIMPVHIHGLCADMDALAAVAKKHKLVIIEDAAQAHGATYKGKNAGQIGLSAGFSLQSGKNLAAGEGGLFVTNDDRQAELANQYRNFGENVKPSDFDAFDPKKPLDETRAYDSVSVGWMYRGNELMAALTRSRLKRLPEDTQRVQRNAQILIEGLKGMPGLFTQAVPTGQTSVWHKFRVRVDAHVAGVADKLPPGATSFRECLREALVAEGLEPVLWQTEPVPAQGLFQTQEGFGRGVPWSLPFASKVNYDPAQFVQTRKLLDNSFVLFSQSHPLIAQDETLVQRYVIGIKKVWDNLPAICARYREKALADVKA